MLLFGTYGVNMRGEEEHGFSLLEGAASIAVCLPILLGVIDVLRIFQTQAALTEAAKLAARHLSTTHGSGVKIKPADRKWEFQWVKRDWMSGGTEVTVGGSTPEGSIPAACLNLPAGASCERRLHSPTIPSNPVRREIDLGAAAKLYARKDIETALPNAIFDCTDPERANCAAIEAAAGPAALVPGSNTASLDRSIEVRVSYRLPLLILPFEIKAGTHMPSGIKRATWNVQAASQARVEHSFIDSRLYIEHNPE